MLAIGCGLGAIEHFVAREAPGVELHIHDVAPQAWRWIARDVPAGRRHVGLIPGCLPEGVQFDVAYLCGVDYALDDDDLTKVLVDLRGRITSGTGRCLILSGSLEPSGPEARSPLGVSARRAAGALLEVCRLRPRRQFWGWTRTAGEYRALMRKSGYRAFEEGMLDTPGGTYWIAGAA